MTYDSELKLWDLKHPIRKDRAACRANVEESVRTGGLNLNELFWRDQYSWLQECGYTLRPRYDPDWKPSWGSKILLPHKYRESHDGISSTSLKIMDATRADSTPVVLKVVRPSSSEYEMFITAAWAPRTAGAHPHNHNTPIHEVLQMPSDPTTFLLVLPKLRKYANVPFETIGEAVAFFQQMFEGLSFLHANGVAHRDIKAGNVMMDPSAMFPESFHFMRPQFTPDLKKRVKPFTRTERPPAYYFIDFGISGFYPQQPAIAPIHIPDVKAVPEHQRYIAVKMPFLHDLPSLLEPRKPTIAEKPAAALTPREEVADVFPVDVFLLGHMIKEDFLDSKCGFGFMDLLVGDMTQADPRKRLNAFEVLARFREIRHHLTTRKLRSRVVDHNESLPAKIAHAIPHWRRRLNYIAHGTPAVPLPLRAVTDPMQLGTFELPIPALLSLPPGAHIPVPPQIAELLYPATRAQHISPLL